MMPLPDELLLELVGVGRLVGIQIPPGSEIPSQDELVVVVVVVESAGTTGSAPVTASTALLPPGTTDSSVFTNEFSPELGELELFEELDEDDPVPLSPPLFPSAAKASPVQAPPTSSAVAAMTPRR
jgi:hypothetical protein